MSLTLIASPFTISPSGNSSMYVVDTNLLTTVYVNVRVRENVTGNLIATLRIYPTPNNVMRYFIEVGEIIHSYTANKLFDYFSTIVLNTGLVFSYYLEIDEVILVGGAPVVNSTLTTSGVPRGAFRGKLDNITMKGYTMFKYTLNGAPHNPTNGLLIFSTMQPRVKSVLPTSDEALYFFQNGAAIPGLSTPETPQGRVNFYDRSGVLIDTLLIDVGFVNNIFRSQFRVNMSPAIVAGLATQPLANIGRYEFYLIGTVTFDDVETPISEKMTYIIDDGYCNAPAINVFWVNKFGAVDSYSMVHPEDSISAERAMMLQSPVQYDSVTGLYSNFKDIAYNVEDRIINTGTTQYTTAFTRSMNDIHALWLSSIIYSPQTWIKLTPSQFIPTYLQDTDMLVQQALHLTAPNIKQLKFKLSDNFTPDFNL